MQEDESQEEAERKEPGSQATFADGKGAEEAKPRCVSPGVLYSHPTPTPCRNSTSQPCSHSLSGDPGLVPVHGAETQAAPCPIGSAIAVGRRGDTGTL